MNATISRQTMTEREFLNYKKKMMRQKEVRKKFLLIVFTLFLIFSLAITLYAFRSNASSNTEKVSYKYYASIRVQYGDTLWSIADKYNDKEHYKNTQNYIAEVVSINRLKSEDIKAGQYIIVPYYSYDFIP